MTYRTRGAQAQLLISTKIVPKSVFCSQLLPARPNLNVNSHWRCCRRQVDSTAAVPWYLDVDDVPGLGVLAAGARPLPHRPRGVIFPVAVPAAGAAVPALALLQDPPDGPAEGQVGEVVAVETDQSHSHYGNSQEGYHSVEGIARLFQVRARGGGAGFVKQITKVYATNWRCGGVWR